jgi:hypothetical protein
MVVRNRQPNREELHLRLQSVSPFLEVHFESNKTPANAGVLLPDLLSAMARFGWGREDQF